MPADNQTNERIPVYVPKGTKALIKAAGIPGTELSALLRNALAAELERRGVNADELRNMKAGGWRGGSEKQLKDNP